MNSPLNRPLPPLETRASAFSETARHPRSAKFRLCTLVCLFLSALGVAAAPKDPDTFNAVQQILTNRLPIVVDNLLDLNRRLNSVELKLSTLSNQPAGVPANFPAPQVDMRAITQSISSTITEQNKATLN